MKIAFYFLFIFIFQYLPAYANGGAAALDEMILHQRSGLEKARSVRQTGPKELSMMFDDIIREHERELKRMTEMRRRLFSEAMEESPDRKSDAPFRPSEELRKMEEEMMGLFNRFRSRLGKSSLIETFPKVEIEESAKGYEVKAEVPGISPDEVKVRVSGNQLLIEGKREEEIKKEDKGVVESEFVYGQFKRTISLDEKVDPKTMKVSHKNGVLEIQVKKLRTSI